MAVDYNVLFQNPSIGQSVRSGMQTGLAIRSMQEQKKKVEEDLLKKQEFDSDLALLRDDWNPDRANDFILKYPQMSSAITEYNKSITDRQRQTKANSLTQVYAAAQAGNYDLVENILNRRLEAATNSQDQAEIDATNVMLSNLKMDPESVRETSYIMMAGIMGPEEAKKIAEGAAVVTAENRARELQSFAVTEAEAKAAEAAVRSKYAELSVVTDIVSKGGDASGLITDPEIKKFNNQLVLKRNQLEAAERGQNELQRQKLELEIADIETKREEASLKKINDAESAQAGTQLTLDTIQRIKDLGGTKFDVFGRSVFQASTGPIEGRLPGLNQSVVDFQSLIETLKSQSFLENVKFMRGLGALTENEGKRLESRIASLNLSQSAETLKKNLDIIETEFQLAMDRSIRDYGNLLSSEPDLASTEETESSDSQPTQSSPKVLSIRPATGG